MRTLPNIYDKACLPLTAVDVILTAHINFSLTLFKSRSRLFLENLFLKFYFGNKGLTTEVFKMSPA